MDYGWFETSLNVADIAESVAFYERLGFARVDGDFAMKTITLQKGDCRISLYEGHLNPARPQLIFWQGDVEAITRDLEQKGVAFHRRLIKDDHGGVGSLLFDPDGHPLYFVNIPGVTRREPDSR